MVKRFRACVTASLRAVTDDSRTGGIGLVLIGARQCPYGLVRPLIGGDIAREFDASCVAATNGILTLGD